MPNITGNVKFNIFYIFRYCVQVLYTTKALRPFVGCNAFLYYCLYPHLFGIGYKGIFIVSGWCKRFLYSSWTYPTNKV